MTNYGIGARGIDIIARTANGVTSFGFPVYDLHGNMVATLGRSGSSFSVGNERSFDAWGNVRSGSGVNTGRYCANLGHKQDDESGLTYMRARYYEGTSGRFLSQDVTHCGPNWYIYASNVPTVEKDRTGHGPDKLLQIAAFLWFMANVNQAEDGSDVENMYGFFMSVMNFNYLALIGIPEDIADFISLISEIYDCYKPTPPDWLKLLSGNPGGLLTPKFPTDSVSKFAMIAFAYGARLQWYVDDIDR